MRLTFIVLIVLNLLLAGWRFGFGLPKYFSEGPRVSMVTPVEPSGSKLLLLAESPLVELSVDVGTSKEPLICPAVGPFVDKTAAASFVERLAVLDVRSQISLLEQKTGERYWVYFPAEPAVGDSRKRLAELQSRGVDSYLIPKGDLANGISLGVYSKESSAKKRLSELRALGFDPQVKLVAQTAKEVWVILGWGEKEKIAESLWRELLGDTISLREQQNLCLDIASP
jgi:hypothetical protein